MKLYTLRISLSNGETEIEENEARESKTNKDCLVYTDKNDRVVKRTILDNPSFLINGGFPYALVRTLNQDKIEGYKEELTRLVIDKGGKFIQKQKDLIEKMEMSLNNLRNV